MGYVDFVLFFCPVGKSSGGTSALLEGVCGMPIQLHAFRRAAAPPLNFHEFRFMILILFRISSFGIRIYTHSS
jgi:hypothetical protein